ncbi:MAG: hypothetical protein KDD70_15015 [Bdellovibrionales bacterium]|nr:hypothetical protein [Bdellovibrionales bacterium]
MPPFFLALVVGLIAGVNPHILLAVTKQSKRYFTGWARRSAIITLVFWPIFYFGMPAFVGPLGGWSWIIMVPLAINLLISVPIRGERTDVGKFSLTVGIVMAVLLLFFAIGSMGITRWESQKAMIGEVTVREDIEEHWKPVELDHMIQVQHEQARFRVDQAFGSAGEAIGSKFHVGELHIQKVGGELVWVGALEYNGFFRWLDDELIPGYVMISAEDRNKDPKLVLEVDGKALGLRYSPSAFFGDELNRYLYFKKGYQDVQLVDYTLEIDEGGHPFYVITMVKPTKFWTCTDVVGLLIVDPQTGEVTEFSKENFGEVPAWVDRIMPEDLTAQYINWWGEYVDGWLNSWTSQQGVVQCTSWNNDYLKVVWGSDGQAYWFTGITSSSSKDGALVGYMLVNTRTGEAFRYKAQGHNEAKVISVINGSVGYRNWHATRPILYNLHGRLAWVAPVVDVNHAYKGMAIVDTSDTQVAFGEDKLHAVRAFDNQVFASNGNSLNLSEDSSFKKIQARVKRAQVWNDSGESTLRFTIEAEEYAGMVFSAGLSAGNGVPLVRDGDSVNIQFRDVQEGTVPVTRLSFVENPIIVAPLKPEEDR